MPGGEDPDAAGKVAYDGNRAGTWSVQTPDNAVRTDAPNPPHSLPALTTYELKDYRRLLECALNDTTIGTAPVAADLRRKLDDVLREQEERDRIRRGKQSSL